MLLLAVSGSSHAQGAAIPVEGYELVWSDEFDGTELDMTKWDHRLLGPRRDAVNVKDTVSLDGQGHLVLTTKKEGDSYHTAMIGTEGKYETTFGYFECRAKMQTEFGHWSAFWLQSPTIGNPLNDPAVAGTEIDIYEYHKKMGNDRLEHNLHWNGYKEHHKHAGGKATVPGLSTGWHTFGLLWTDKEYVFYVDGKETWRTGKAISQRPQYIILSLEVGKWAGDIAQAKLPDHFYVDYVRVYQKPDKHPNLVIVFPDQMRGQALGFLNEDPVIAPHLDRIARESLVLPQAVANYPVCSPFRAMLMTGKYPHANRVIANVNSRTEPFGVELQESDRCWSDVLNDEGYNLGYIGKWHLDSPRTPYVDCSNNRGEPKWNEWCPPERRHGFDYWYS